MVPVESCAEIGSVGSTPVAPLAGVVEVTVAGAGAGAVVVKDQVPPAGVVPAIATVAVNVVEPGSVAVGVNETTREVVL